MTIAKRHLFNYKINIVADKFTFTNPDYNNACEFLYINSYTEVINDQQTAN